MPYNPGIQDRSGEILAGGISQFGGSLAQVIAALGQQRDQAEELRTQMGGPKGKAYGDEGSSGMDLSMFGVPEGPDEGTGEGSATPEDKAKSAAKVAKALRDLGEHGYGYDRNMLETMGLPELRGLARRSEMQAIQQERATNQKLKLAEVQRMLALNQETQQRTGARAKLQDIISKMRAPTVSGYDPENGEAISTPGQFSIRDLLPAAMQAGMDPKDVAELGQAAHYISQANPDARNYAPTSTKLSGRDIVYSPHTGAFQVMPDMSGEARSYVDPETNEPVPGVMMMGGKTVRLPKETDTTGPQHRSMQTLVDAEKALQGIEEEISAYNNRSERAKTDKTVKPYPESRLQDLMKRKARIEKVLDEEPAKPAATTAAPTTPKRQVERVTKLPSPVLEESSAALEVKAQFQAGKLTKEEAKKKLQDLGFK